MIRQIVRMSHKDYILKETKCFLLLMIYTASTLLFPLFVSFIIDKGISQGDMNATFCYTIGMLAVGAVSVLTQYLQKVSFYKLGQEILIDIKQKIYGRILRTNLNYWSENKVGDVITVLEDDVASLETLLTSTVSGIAVNVFVVIGITVFLTVTNWKCGVIVSGMAIVFAYMQRKNGDRVQKSMYDLRKKIGEMISFTNESLQSINELQASGFEDVAKNRYLTCNKTVLEASVRQVKKISVASSIGSMFNVAGLLAVIGFGAYQVIKGEITVGTLFALTVYVQRLYGPIISLGQSYIDIRNSLPRIRKISELMNTTNMINSGNDLLSDGGMHTIAFRNVSFSYGENNTILDRFNLTVDPGKTLGIVGENGSGKTTMLKLLMNICEPQSGKVMIDGKKISEYDNDCLRKVMGYVGQNGVMLSGTLREVLDPKNICTDEALLSLMKEFMLDDGIFYNGLDTMIDENHRNISGGEFQKIALIRAFTESKDIYLLDEPTSAMDPECEKTVCERLRERLCGKTALIITHRPRILDICDDIVHF